MTDPRHHDVRVRRSPRISVFLALGAAVGALAALVAVGVAPPDPEISAPQALGFLVLLLAPSGALVAGGVAVLIDRVGERRARIVRAERITADEQSSEQTSEPPARG